MTRHAVEILSRWTAEAIGAIAADDAGREAARLAAEFTAYAEDTGLNIEELENDLGEDLLSYMKDALEARAAATNDPLDGDE